MSTSVSDLARAVSEATRARRSFEAQQAVRAGKIEVVAHVRWRAPDRLAVNYETYSNPLADLDDVLGGSAEFVGADLVGSSLAYDGAFTSLLDAKAAVALRSPGRDVYEPIPGLEVLGETRFLDDLARDYLLRDKGSGTLASRPTRILGLKPKHARTASALRVILYPFERAELVLDAETFFPLRIEFVPSPDLPVLPLLGPDPLVTVEYSDVRDVALDESSFAPPFPAGTRVFYESRVAEGDLGEGLPFPLPLDSLRQCGYGLVDGHVGLVLDAARERGHAAAVCVRRGDDPASRSAVVLRVGNYVSRHMARRRSFAAEHGERVDVGCHAARYVDRRQALSGLAASAGVPPLADLCWETDGAFWVLTGESIDREELLALAPALAQRGGAQDPTEAGG